MKLLMIVPMIALLAACQGDKKEQDDSAPSAAMPDLTPNTAVKDIYEYYQPNGGCDPSEKFGDGASGCLMYVQVTRFNDGSAFFSASVGVGYLWEINMFLPPGTGLFNKTMYYYTGSTTVAYQFSGDLRPAVPTFAANYDCDGNMANTSPQAVTLSYVQRQ